MTVQGYIDSLIGQGYSVSDANILAMCKFNIFSDTEILLERMLINE